MHSNPAGSKLSFAIRRVMFFISLTGCMLVIFVLPSSAQIYRETVLHSFACNPDGEQPLAGLIRDDNGYLYGTTYFGGSYDQGTIFRISPRENEVVLHSFSQREGIYPRAGLVRDPQGSLYGTTYTGGGAGTVFRLNTKGTFTVVHSFMDSPDGATPYDRLFRDSQGNLFGTTVAGGSQCCNGVVFKINAAGRESVLHSFNGGSDGLQPVGDLVADESGTLYGTTYSGGSSNLGVVFKLDSAGNETILHTFSGQPDGSHPQAGLLRDDAGNLYGTTWDGGTGHCNNGFAPGCGVIFRINSAGDYTRLHDFGPFAGGQFPSSGLIQDASGYLYGTTSGGGAGHLGVVYRLSSAGEETVLHSFTGGKDGASPYNDYLLLDEAGNLYGTTQFGGDQNKGTIFELTPH